MWTTKSKIFIFHGIFLSLEIGDFETSVTRFFYFFSKAQKVKYLRHLSVNLPMVFIYKFLKIFNFLIQPTGEPWEHHLGEVRYTLAHFWAKSFLLNVSENVKKLCYFESCDFNFNVFEIFLNVRQAISTLSVIRLLWICFVA